MQHVLEADPEYYTQNACEAIRRTAETGEIGESLGNHARNIEVGDTAIYYSIGDQKISGGFVTQKDLAQTLGEQRHQVFEMTFGEPVTMEVQLRGKPVNETTGKQTEVELTKDAAQEQKSDSKTSVPIVPFNSGETIYEQFESSQGLLKVAADVIIDGNNLHLKDFAIYPVDAEKFDLGHQEIQKLLGELRDKAKSMGFDTLRITGLRYSGAKPGKEVNLLIKLK